MATYTIRKTFHFSASHQLTHLPPGHQCARLHGHNYQITLELAAPSLNLDVGFVQDYGELDAFRRLINDQFDHRHLNEVLGRPELTTAENLAAYFYDVASKQFPALVAVAVCETPNTWAEYRIATV